MPMENGYHVWKRLQKGNAARERRHQCCRGNIIITIDSREQNGDAIHAKLDSLNIESEIATLPYATGTDYLISQTYGTVCIQRKDCMKELASQMEELRFDILPRLLSFSDTIDANPVLLVEEDFTTGEKGYLFRKDPTSKFWVETGLHALAYYGFLESVRMMGCEVACTRNLEQSIWYMVSLDSYLSTQHYPKHQKSHKPYAQAMGMLCCVPGIGQKRAAKVLQHHSIADIAGKGNIEGLTDKQLTKVRNVLRWK